MFYVKIYLCALAGFLASDFVWGAFLAASVSGIGYAAGRWLAG